MIRTYGTAPFRCAVLHGGPGVLGDLGGLALELSRRSGLGIAEPIQTESSIDCLLLELEKELRAACALPVTLIGHSWGAWLALFFAAAHPGFVRQLILVGCAPLTEAYVDKIDVNRKRRLTGEQRLEYERLCDCLNQGTAKNRDEALGRLGELAALADKFCPAEAAEEFPLRTDGALYEKIWPEAAQRRSDGALLYAAQSVSAKICLIHGEFDSHPLEGILEPLHNRVKSTHVLRRCGHTPWREAYAKEAFYEILVAELLNAK